MEVHSRIPDSKILNLWTTKPCFKIIHDLPVSVLDTVSNLSPLRVNRSSKNDLRYAKCVILGTVST